MIFFACVDEEFQDSLKLFEDLVNMGVFSRTPFVVVLNKVDTLQKDTTIVKKLFPDYQGEKNKRNSNFRNQ